jgi:hypothetical protein
MIEKYFLIDDTKVRVKNKLDAVQKRQQKGVLRQKLYRICPLSIFAFFTLKRLLIYLTVKRLCFYTLSVF